MALRFGDQRVLSPLHHGNYAEHYAKGPHLHEYLHEMHRQVLSKYDVMTVGEGAGGQIQDALKFVDPARQELQMFYHFDVQGWGRNPRDNGYPDSTNRRSTNRRSTNRRLVDLKGIFTR